MEENFTQIKQDNGTSGVLFCTYAGIILSAGIGAGCSKNRTIPRPWTTHIVISDISDLNRELLDWVKQAYEFAEYK